MNLLLLQSPGSSNPIFGFLPILFIFAIFYFLLFMPMQRQKKQQQKMLRELQSGNTVVTNGGIIGTIVKLDDDTLVLRVKPDNIKIEMARSAVASLVSEEVKKA
ncbi:MAG: preprotein translocase subunit YajC [Bryobacteraceae bacterium]|nr:preprotein translocase subunit YajC [Bryobacteraceae bacterium]